MLRFISSTFEINTLSRCSICSDEFASARELKDHQKETEHGYSLACKVSILAYHPVPSFCMLLTKCCIICTCNIDDEAKTKRPESEILVSKSYFSRQVCDNFLSGL